MFCKVFNVPSMTAPVMLPVPVKVKSPSILRLSESSNVLPASFHFKYSAIACPNCSCILFPAALSSTSNVKVSALTASGMTP